MAARVTGVSADRVARLALRAIQGLQPERRAGVTILAYHLVGAESGTPVDVSANLFRAQMSLLARTARVRSLTDALADLAAGTCGPRDTVITFDDAFANFKEVAWPILADLELPCTIYAPVGFVTGRSVSPLTGASSLAPMTWHDLRELVATNRVTIGSHSYWHRDLRTMSIPELRRDLREARQVLENELGVRAAHFCYPQAKWSTTVEREVAQVYDSAAIAGGRLNTAQRFNRHRLSRIPIKADMSSSIEQVVGSRVWVEEWIAGRVRLWR